MGAHQGQLQLRAHLFWNVAAGKRAEAGGDSVDRRGILGQFFDPVACGGDLVQSLGGDFYRGTVAGNGHDFLNGQRSDADCNGGWVCIRHDDS